MNILKKTTIIVSILALTAVLVPSFVFAGNTSVYFSDYLQTKNNPDGHKSYISKIFDLSYDADYEVKVYYRANSGSNEKYEEFNVYVDGSLIGKATDPNEGDDFENKSLGTHNFNSGRHTLKVEHAHSYSQVLLPPTILPQPMPDQTNKSTKEIQSPYTVLPVILTVTLSHTAGHATEATSPTSILSTQLSTLLKCQKTLHTSVPSRLQTPTAPKTMTTSIS